MLPLLGLATIVVLLGGDPVQADVAAGRADHRADRGVADRRLRSFRRASSSIDGLKSLAPVVGMFVFAILYFGIITDAGMLDPIIDRILRDRRHAADAHRDGHDAAGAADPPRRLRRGRAFSSRFPRCCRSTTGSAWTGACSRAAVSMAAGVNFLPWTGPMIRASASLHLPISAHLQSADSGADRRPRVRVRHGVLARPARGEAARPAPARAGRVPMPQRELTPKSRRCAGRGTSGSTSC